MRKITLNLNMKFKKLEVVYDDYHRRVIDYIIFLEHAYISLSS